jgi:hypothetical protein
MSAVGFAPTIGHHGPTGGMGHAAPTINNSSVVAAAAAVQALLDGCQSTLNKQVGENTRSLEAMFFALRTKYYP